MISHLEANELLDLYEPLLTKRQQEVLELYFQEDLSLAEIQENLKVSKAAVYDALKKGVAAMENFEQILHLHTKSKVLAGFLADHPEYEKELGSLLD
ncbi:DNA-binding protein [Erysipelotrichaceae bacterium RD49]|nr:DNA-binding protein [Erysipelotrichaceae bacterium RD49]